MASSKEGASNLTIALVEPFFSGSHKTWATQLQSHSAHTFKFFTLPGKYWKWRMRTGAVSLARMVNESGCVPDVFLVSDMLDVSLFKNLLKPDLLHIPCVLYMHENQLSYPWSENFKYREIERKSFAFVNLHSAIVADVVVFNSHYHQNTFFDNFESLLSTSFDICEAGVLENIRKKSSVLCPGFEFQDFESSNEKRKEAVCPLVVWNHRWEYDKNPKDFVALLKKMRGKGLDFEIAVMGEVPDTPPVEFEELKPICGNELLYYGYVSRAEYKDVLGRAHLLPVTSHHDFFGISVLEAIAAGCFPLLPDREAYPEHIPVALQNFYLYECNADLEMRFERALCSYKDLPYGELREYISKYDISRLISEYDKLLLSTACEGASCVSN